jgi:hypothetical protein
MNETVEPAIEHTDVAEASMLKATANPDDAVAVTVYVGPATTAPTGAVEVNVIVWLFLLTANDCAACGAAFQFPSPAWLASITQVPEAVNDTVDPAIEQTDDAVASIVNVTGRPDDAVAVSV